MWDRRDTGPVRTHCLFTSPWNKEVKNHSPVTHLCLPLLAADLLAPEVRSRSVGRMAVEWAVTGPSCSAHWLPGRRWPWPEGEATKPSSSDSSCCFFRMAFCLALSLARFALARSYRSCDVKHTWADLPVLSAYLQRMQPLWTIQCQLSGHINNPMIQNNLNDYFFCDFYIVTVNKDKASDVTNEKPASLCTGCKILNTTYHN